MSEELKLRDKSPYERILDDYCRILDDMRTTNEVGIIIRKADIRLWVAGVAEELGWDNPTRYLLEDEFFPAFSPDKQTVDDYLDLLAVAPLKLLADRQFPAIDVTDSHSVEKIIAIASDHGSEKHGKSCIEYYPDEDEDEFACEMSLTCPARQLVTDLHEVASYILLHEEVATANSDTIQSARMRQSLQVIENCLSIGGVCSPEDFREFLALERESVTRFMNPASYVA